MSSAVEICNLALSNLGKSNINTLTEASAEARACNQFYEHTRDMMVQAFPWTWAGKTASLASVTNTKDGQWEYAYQRPSDCLKVRWIRPKYDDDEVPVLTQQQEMSYPYAIEGDTIFCNLSPAWLRYTQRITDAGTFPPLFVDALSWQLAVRLAMPLTRDPKMRADAYQVAQVAIGAAQSADANEERHSSDHDSDLVAEREHGATFDYNQRGRLA